MYCTGRALGFPVAEAGQRRLSLTGSTAYGSCGRAAQRLRVW